MTQDQFDALAKLLRLRASVSTAAARLHFVDGLRIADAARAAGCTPNAASDCVRRCRAGIATAQRMVGQVKMPPSGTSNSVNARAAAST
jgi:hypothetical protein